MVLCGISMAAGALIGSAIAGADVVESISQKLRSVLHDAELATESESVAVWQGSYHPEAGSAPIPVAVYLFKSQKRLRIHVLDDKVTPARTDTAIDAIADAVGASVLIRTYAEPADRGTRGHRSGRPKLAPQHVPPARRQLA